MNRIAIEALACGLFAAVCFAGGWVAEGWRMSTEIADIKKTHAEQQSAAMTQALRQLVAARAHGEQLAARVAEQENALNTLAQEKDDAVRRLTVGRRCLDSAAVRVLNAGRRPDPKPAVPEAAGQPVPADAAFATDTDVGVWIGQCRRGYDTCRGRLQAIADFHEGLPVE